MSPRKLPDDFYDRIKPRLHERILREVAGARRVLDLGCGACELVEYLAEGCGGEVTGVDIRAQAFPGRRRTAGGARFSCIEEDASALASAVECCFDAVVSVWALHEMDEPAAVLEEAHRLLEPGGRIVVVDFPRGSLAQTLWGEDYYAPAEIAAMLRGAGLCEVRANLIESGQVAWVGGVKGPTES